MKKIIVLALCLIVSLIANAQESEFVAHSNGLIYSETTMSKLTSIVDSLNLKYLSCELNKTYLGKAQTVGHSIKLEQGNISEVIIDLENNISYENFKEKYAKAEIMENVLVVRFQYQNYKGKDIIEFSEIDVGDGYGMEISFDKQLDDYKEDLKSPWIYHHIKKTDYWEESINIFYLPNKLETKPVPDKYAKMIGYADCLIDTTTAKFKKNLKRGWVDLPLNWEKLSLKKQSKILDEMRSTQVVGSCSQDSRPRIHAINIAMLSASTANWQVFLKSHLDIMNDRFDRASDGSYAWAQRKTYIKELEELNINVLDLILGISLRTENPSEHHYYGNIRRIGRALAEAQHRENVESELIAMISNDELDDYNRILGYYVFLNYVYSTEDESLKEVNKAKLKNAISHLPGYISDKIEID
jgi:hypothetical protein